MKFNKITKANTSDDGKAPDIKDGTDLSRRLVLKAAVGLAAGAALPYMSSAGAVLPAPHGKSPNVLLFTVDQMRFPKVFPKGIDSPEEFLKAFMPNTYSLWNKGVKFSNHITAATACSPSRGVLATGLYAQQTYMAATLLTNPDLRFATSPPLLPTFPTYGKYFQSAGYATPYIGKWHCSVPHTTDGQGELSLFGFQAFMDPDPTGFNLQGSYGAAATTQSDNVTFYNDADIANTAAAWLSQQTPTSQKWCLTVSFQNPHDQEFFPAGTEFQTFDDLFSNPQTNPINAVQLIPYANGPSGNAVTWEQATTPYFSGIGGVATPKSYGYPHIPSNWESLETLEANKPGWQTVFRQGLQAQFGGITDDPNVKRFGQVPVLQYPGGSPKLATTYPGYVNHNHLPPNLMGIGYAPYNYWQRAFDSYTQYMEIVDKEIGKVLDAIPEDVLENTVIVFTADHGDYTGAHGLLTGKTGNAYDEAIRVPLIVVDNTHRFTGDINIVRNQLTSSVDVMPMLVSFIYDGKPTKWQTGDSAVLYGNRYNMFPLLKSANIPGREYALFSSDEVMSSEADFVTPADQYGLKTPWHIMSMITPKAKLVLYANWIPGTNQIITSSMEGEYYDYGTKGGREETLNTYKKTDSRKEAMQERLLNELVPHELRQDLPAGKLAASGTIAKTTFLAFIQDEAGFPFTSGMF